jgi:hypothetical protein
MSAVLGYLILGALIVTVLGAITRPTWALALLLVQYPLEQLLQSYLVFFVQRNEIFNYGVGALAIVSLGVKCLRKPEALKASLNPVSVLALSYYALAGISVLWSPTSQSAWDILRPGVSYVLMFLVLAPLLVDSLEEVREFFVVLVVMSTIIAFLVLTNPAGDFVRGRFALRLGGIGLKESNPLAMSDLASGLLLAATTLNIPRQSLIVLAFRLVGGVVGTGLLLAASSRGQVLAAGLVAVIFYPISVQVRNLGQFFVRIGLLAVLVVALLVGVQLFRAQSVGTEKRWDAAELADASATRLENIRVMMAEWGQRPLAWPIGLGTGGFAAYEQTSHEPYVHNMIVEALGEFGVIGLGLFAGMLLATWRCGRRLMAMCWHDPSARAIAASLAALNMFAFLISNKQGSVWVSTQMFTGFLVMARVERILWLEGGLAEPEIEAEADEPDEQAAVT